MLYRLVLLPLGVVLAGCTASPWSSHKQAESKPAPVPAPAISSGAASAPSGLQFAQTDTQAMQQVMAELQQLGAVDPAAQEKLLADLRQTEPSLWPRVLTAFRAAAAYRRQEERQGAAPAGGPRTPATASGVALAEPVALAGNARGPAAAPTPPGSAGNRSASPPGVALAEPAAPAAAPAVLSPPEVVRRVPLPDAQAKAADSQVMPADYEAAVPTEWRGQLGAAIRAMEAETKAAPKGEGELAMQARLRMLYLLAGRREDALRPIADAPAPLQDFWVKQLYGLSTWLDAERTPDAARRAAETKGALNEAIARLAETSPLVVRNLAFCTAVKSYGTIQPFKAAEFSPGQEVLLYAEVENFTAESTPKGFHTSLKVHYQVFDGRGQRVADFDFAPMEEYCQNSRRDFYISHDLHIPKQVYPGKHTLQLTVEDLKSHKVGQSTIDFVVKGDKGEEQASGPGS